MSTEIQSVKEKYSILDRMPVGICILRDDWVVLFWNSCLEDWTNLSRNEILGKKIIDYFPHLSQPKYGSRFQQIFTGGPPTIFSSQIHQYTIPAFLPSGQPRIQQTTVTSISDHVGRSFYALLVIQDVTDLTYRIQDYRLMRDQALSEIKERQRIEEQLRNSQRFIQQIADAAPYLIYIFDLVENRTIYINHQITTLLGYTIEEIQAMGGTFLAQLLHPEDLAHKVPIHYQQFNTLPDSEIVELEYRIKHRVGEWRWFYTRELVFSRNSEGNPLQILGTSQDITEYKRAEEALQYQTEREHLIRAITQHIRKSLNLHEILNTTVTEVRQFLQTDRVIVFRFEKDGSGRVIVESVGESWQPALGEKIYDPCFSNSFYHLYEQGRVRAIDDIYQANLSQCYINLLKPFQVRADLIVPILQGGNGEDPRELEKGYSCPSNGAKLWGLLIAHHCNHARQWQSFEIDLLKQLATQVAIAIQQAELYEQLQAANKELQRLANSDGLTQLANRRRFDEYLEQEWRHLAREKKLLSLILCDVDFFKNYNDTYGHQAGDDCLRLVAQTIQNNVNRSADLVARYGGEEFAVILPNTDLEGATEVAQRIRLSIKNLQVLNTGSQISDYITVSCGVASMIPKLNNLPSKLIESADVALYAAKAQGRDQVQVAS